MAFNTANRNSLLNIPAASGAFIEVLNELMKFKDLFGGLRGFWLLRVSSHLSSQRRSLRISVREGTVKCCENAELAMERCHRQ
jgi:hypothetical protein